MGGWGTGALVPGAVQRHCAPWQIHYPLSICFLFCKKGKKNYPLAPLQLRHKMPAPQETLAAIVINYYYSHYCYLDNGSDLGNHG